jgi:mannose-6-phosphate isomerase-like protein (cupin superfamily)
MDRSLPTEPRSRLSVKCALYRKKLCALAAPLHRHAREDEYSYVLRGRLGAILGDDVVFAKPGDLVFKPRNQWHTFWNASDEPASILGACPRIALFSDFCAVSY